MKLSDIKIVYICPDHNDEFHTRKLHIEKLLSSLGCKDVIHYKSGTETYPACLAYATIEILKTYMNEPILILEDDIDHTNITDFEVPYDADAIYLGLSKNAGHPSKNINLGRSMFEPYNDSLVLVKNMLGAHAVLYTTPSYKLKVIEQMLDCVNNNWYNDVMISRIQKDFKVYATRIPLFYQSIKLNPKQIPGPQSVEAQTKFKIVDDMKFSDI
jgi:hypothetical protein